MDVDSESDVQSMPYIWTQAHTQIWSLRVLKNYRTGNHHGVGTTPPQNGKIKSYQVPPGVRTPPPHNRNSTYTPEARHNNMVTIKRHKIG